MSSFLEKLERVLFYRRPDFVHRPPGPLDPSLEQKYAEYGEKNRCFLPVDMGFERVIDNECMPPTSLRDFMNYLVYVEHDAENLQFYLWLRDYKRRFDNLRPEQRALSPEWTGTEGPVPEPMKSPMSSPMQSTGFPTPRRMLSAEDMRLSEDSGKVKAMNEVIEEANLNAGVLWQGFSCQPFREECTRIMANYIVPGAPRELNLSQRDRSAVLHALQHTTHPSAFKVVSNLVEITLKGQSHPNFVRWSIGNGTRPHTIFGRVLGALVTLIGIAVAIVLTLSSVPRAYRALAVIPFALGVFFVIGTRSGLCPLLYCLGHARELQPWEARASMASSSTVGKSSIFGSTKEAHVEEATIVSSSDKLEDVSRKSFSSYARSLDPFGSSNDFSDEDWVEPYRNKVFWKKIFSPMQKTQEKRVRYIRDQIFLQCAAWTTIISPFFLALFLSLPAGNRF